MFNGGLAGATVQPPLAQPAQAQPQQPYGFEQALEDVLGILGFAEEEEPQLDAEGFVPPQPMEQPYQPRESANMLDREGEAPEVPADAYKRFADDPKRAAARISLLPRGVVPFATAAFDYYGGNNPRNLSLSGLYRKRQLEADIVAGQESPTAEWVRAYAPMAIGAGLGVLKPAKTIMGTAMQAGTAGAAYGGLEEYFSKSVEGEDLDSPARIGRGAIGAGLGFINSAPAGAAGHQVRGMLGKQPAKAVRAQPQERKEPRLDGPVAKEPQIDPPAGAQRESRFEKRYIEDLNKYAVRQIEAGQDIQQIAQKLGVPPKEIARALEVSGSVPKTPRYARARAEVDDILGGAAPKPASQAQRATPKPESFEAKAAASVRAFNKDAASNLRGGLDDIAARKDKLDRKAPHWQKGVFPSPVRRPGAAPETAKTPDPAPAPAPTAQPQKPAPKAPNSEEIAIKAKVAPKTKGPISQREFRRWNNTPAGKESWREVQSNTRRAQLDADAQALKDTANPRPMREVLAKSGYPNAKAPINPSGAKAKSGFAPEKKRGVMEIADDISAKAGRSPAKWARGDKEEFVRQAATQTNMRPSQVYNLLKSYGDEGVKAKRGISTKRIREIMDESRAPKKKD